MPRKRPLIAAVAALLATSFVATENAAAALAVKLGQKPKYTGRLSSNPAIRKQQLIVDPEGILGGSVSVAYDTRIVRLVGVIDPGGFDVTGGFVGVLPQGGITTDLVPLESFLDGFAGGTRSLTGGSPSAADEPVGELPNPNAGDYFEMGFVQVFFSRKDETGTRAADDGISTIPNLPGYSTVAEDGPTGVGDTHALLFEYRDDVPDEFRATYSIFATPPRDGTTSDSLTQSDDPENPIPYTQIGSARLTGSLVTRDPPPGVPLPPAAATGLLALAGVAGGIARKRRMKVRG